MDSATFPISDTIDANKTEPSKEEKRQQRIVFISIGFVGLLVLVCLGTGLVYLLNPKTDVNDVARIRDVFIIIMALESLLIGAVMVILIVQIARLTNLLQNEIKPILDSTNETVNTLRGTTEFLSDNLVRPVIQLNEYIAAMQRLFELLGMGRRKT